MTTIPNELLFKIRDALYTAIQNNSGLEGELYIDKIEEIEWDAQNLITILTPHIEAALIERMIADVNDDVIRYGTPWYNGADNMMDSSDEECIAWSAEGIVSSLNAYHPNYVEDETPDYYDGSEI